MGAGRIEFDSEYEALVTRQRELSKDEIVTLLEYMRRTKVFQPELVMLHGTRALLDHGSSLGPEIWPLYEQVCVTAMHMGYLPWAGHCAEKLLEKFPNSVRIKKLYGLYREA